MHFAAVHLGIEIHKPVLLRLIATRMGRCYLFWQNSSAATGLIRFVQPNVYRGYSTDFQLVSHLFDGADLS
jgi:hypothetical protein